MSQENVEIFKRAVEAWNRDDFAAWLDLLDPEVEWHTALESAFEGPTSGFRGHAGARTIWESYKGGPFRQLESRYVDIRDLGESVLALGEIKVIGQTSNLEFTTEVAHLCVIRGGKITSSRDFQSHAEGLEAAGLR